MNRAERTTIPGARAATGPPRRPGRPRSAALDEAILDAAERQLREHGYAGMALEAVAARAGTTTPSLRRRYRTKAELALAVVDSLRIQPLPAATGQPRADALAILENLRINMLRRDGMATLGTFLAEEHRNPLLMDHFRRRLIQPRRERLRHALAVGVEDGQLPVGADLDAMASLLVGSLYARYLSTGSIPPSWPARTLAIIWPHETIRANG